MKQTANLMKTMVGGKCKWWAAVSLLAVLMVSMLTQGCGAVTAETSSTLHPGQEEQKTDAQAQTDSSSLTALSAQSDLRVAALMGSFAETWLLAGGQLVGVTEDAITEKALGLPEDIAVLGNFNLPNLEAIIALEPDLVLMSSETEAHLALQEPLEKAGINTMFFSVTYFQDYLAMLNACTEITGREDLYQQNGAAVERQIQELTDGAVAHWAEAGGTGQEPRILLLTTYSGGTVVKGSDTLAGEMLKDLGCVNIADESPSLLKELSLEAVIAEDPDYIFVIAMGNSDELAMKNLRESVESHPAWEGLTAVKENRYILLPKELFLYKPNHLWGESYGYLAKILLHDES